MAAANYLGASLNMGWVDIGIEPRVAITNKDQVGLVRVIKKEILEIGPKLGFLSSVMFRSINRTRSVDIFRIF